MPLRTAVPLRRRKGARLVLFTGQLRSVQLVELEESPVPPRGTLFQAMELVVTSTSGGDAVHGGIACRQEKTFERKLQQEQVMKHRIFSRWGMRECHSAYCMLRGVPVARSVPFLMVDMTKTCGKTQR